ncbi:MAG: DMT family transporter [Oscillospiraceae bacterium]|nr:DMT family transporter [Oscillospiraceae bacterium]
MTEKKNPTLGRLALLVTTLIWGTSFVVQKNTLDDISTLHLLAIRFSIATVLMFIIAAKDIKKIGRSYIKGGVLMGIALACAYIVQTYGLVYTTPGKNAFLTASYVVMTPFLYWAYKKRRPGKHNLVAAFLCLIGVGLISLNGSMNINIGDILTIICGVFYAIHIIIIDEQAEGKSIALLTAIQFAVAAVLTWIPALIFEPAIETIPSGAVFSILFLGIVCTGICFLLQTYGQKNTPVSQAAILLTLESVFGTVASIIFYKEAMSIRLVLGFIAMFVAVLISETKLSFLKKH